MVTLKLAAGIVAVCNNQLAVVREITDTGSISVCCDLVTGVVMPASADEMSARSELATQRHTTQRAAALFRSSTKHWERARKRERCVLAVLIGAGSTQQNVIDVDRQSMTCSWLARRPAMRLLI